MSVQVWFAQDETSVRPGDAVSLSLAVENISDRTQTFTVIPAGLSASWTTVTRPNVTLFGGSRDVIEVVARPPAIFSTTEGPASIAVRVVPQEAPDDTAMAETIVTVEGFDDRRVTTLQPVQRARRRATFELLVENRGNNLANCRLHLVDPSDRVDGSFDPPAVGVTPGSRSLVRLHLRAKPSYFRRAERHLDFEIEATEPDHEPAVGRGTLVQPPTISARSLGRAAAWAAAALVVLGGWAWVVKPELNDAADRAVADRLADLQPTATSTTVAAPATTPVEPVVAEPVGEPEIYRIAVDAGIDQERSESLSIPPDATFHLTDVVLQNPNGDFGTAQLLRNGEVLYTFPLASMTAPNEFQPRVTPIPVAATDNLVLSVSCKGAGDTTATGCEIAVLLGGLLVPIEQP